MASASAGIVSRIRVENFMCHTSLSIDLADSVNFITGQNGSGKSAILTALCVAFGCRAKGTQRATTLKDFIKTGCSYAVVCVEIKNKGEDAYKHHIYGDLIIVERRITDSTTSTILKDHLGKKVSQKMAELRELIEHFNIDVENPCVIMSQDKSREFLHSGNDKDKFKFFFKATLLQQVSELLQSIKGHLESAKVMVSDLEKSIRPIQKELIELKEKIKNMKHIEEITQQAQVLKKKLAWSWVYDVDKQIEDQKVKLGTLRDRIPTCQDRIDKRAAKLEESRRQFLSKKAEIASLMESTLEVRKKKDELQQELSMATKKKYEFQAELSRNTSVLQKLGNQVSRLMQQIDDIQESHIKFTQAEESELKEQLKDIQSEIDATQARVTGLKDEEKALSDSLSLAADATRVVDREIEENERKRQRISSQIQDLKRRQTNKVTTFGGDRVLRLLQVIERRHRGFRNPPIGPIGVHVRLVDETWAFAVETSIGKLLESFVVTDSKDAHLLRSCAREANYNNLKIFIYDFSRPRLNIPRNMLPSTSHPTIFSVLQSDSDVVMNVLVDMAGIERQVLVRDYEMGKRVAFEQRVRNLKDVYTSDGFRMFCRGCVETTLPPNNRSRVGRLCGSIEEYIYKYEKETESMDEHIQQCKKRKRSAEEECRKLEGEVQTIKRQRMKEESFLMSKQDKLQSMKIAHETETNTDNAPDVNELHQEISKLREEMKEHENSFDEIKASLTMSEQKATDLKISFEKLCESAKGEIFDAIAESERELVAIEQSIRTAEEEKAHYEAVMRTKVLSAIEEAKDLYQKLQHDREESCKKASIICSESEVESLEGCAGNTPEQLSAQLNRLQHRLQHESHRCTEPVEDLQILYEKKERKIMVKQQTYQTFTAKLNTLLEALDLRSNKFQRNASLLKRQLTWQFNGHLGRKGFSGHVDVDYSQKTLSVTMVPDSSDDIVRDTRGLSGGERSFSTLCFALALHEMTEAPFRAMDEFDVFMDAVSRKISLETVVDFAVQQGSQWIFITPHDISMVNAGEKVKKQQMAAPRA